MRPNVFGVKLERNTGLVMLFVVVVVVAICCCLLFVVCPGLNVKLLVIDLPQGEVRVPVNIRAEQSWTVQALKQEIAEVRG